MIYNIELRKTILNVHFCNSEGHLGSSLTIADIIETVNPLGDDSPTFFLDAGHAAVALYAHLYLQGIITREMLFSYGKPGGLSIHAEPPFVPLASGSLGMQLSHACGMALSNPSERIVVLTSDAGVQEGSFFESAMFAGHHNLNNIILIIADNDSQSIKSSKETIWFEDIQKTFEGLGWAYTSGDGHYTAKLKDCLGMFGSLSKPLVFHAKCIQGKGISFLEDNPVLSHYKRLDSKEYLSALEELENEKQK